MQHIEERECTFEDLAKLEEYKCRAKRDLRIAGIFVLVISVLLPLLPPKYHGSKAMLDIMSYPEAVMWIVILFAVVFLWSVYFMLYGLHKDLKEKRKIVIDTSIDDVRCGKYRGRNYCYFSAAGLPYSIKRISITPDEFTGLTKGERVIIDYSKYGKKLLSWKKA